MIKTPLTLSLSMMAAGLLIGCSGNSETVASEDAVVAENAATMAEEAGAGTGQGIGLQEGALRLSATPDAPSAAYLTITGGATDMVITGIDSMNAARVEMHESRRENGMVSMAPVESITVPANGRVEMRPGGLHLMLFGIDTATREAGTILLRLRFADGSVSAVAATTANMATLEGSAGGAEAAAHGGDHSGH
jgi:copper(I)-binding protein